MKKKIIAALLVSSMVAPCAVMSCSAGVNSGTAILAETRREAERYDTVIRQVYQEGIETGKRIGESKAESKIKRSSWLRKIIWTTLVAAAAVYAAGNVDKLGDGNPIKAYANQITGLLSLLGSGVVKGGAYVLEAIKDYLPNNLGDVSEFIGALLKTAKDDANATDKGATE